MNSIKNAIVTVTLLVVGYGSYLVLQDPPEGNSLEEFAANNANEPSLSISSRANGTPTESHELDLKIKIEDAPQPTTSLANSSPSTVAPLLAAVTDSQVTTDTASTQSQPTPPAVASLPELPSEFGFYEDENRVSETPVEPLVATAALPPEDVLDATPNNPAPNTGPFAAPIVTAVAPAPVAVEPVLGATNESVLPKVDTSNVGPLPRVDIPQINDSLGPIPPSDSTEGSVAFEKIWLNVQRQLRDRELVKALSALSPSASDPSLSKEQRNRCLQLLDQLAGSVIYSREHHLEPEYVVQAGETLDEIAAHHNVPLELLARINGIAPPYALTTGEILKVVRGPFRAEIGLFKSDLTLYAGSNYAGRFPVTIGPDLPRKEAFYDVAEKSNGRSYFDRRTGNEVLHGDVSNRYGNHWLGLRGEHITTGHSVGLHGRPIKSAGDSVGSISLDPLDAEDVFSILSISSRVHVRP